MDSNEVKVFLYKNSTRESARKTYLLDKSQDKASILAGIGSAVGINAVKVYNSAGADIFTNMAAVKDNDALYVS